ncbi:MAG: PIN domain-containing protein [Oscillibacter sp.]|nr:PIN domain-containing protein [Oscillibacter sp.]
MTLIDTNVILRFLLNDVPEQAEQAKAVIEAGAFTTIEVIAEVVYILRKAYQSDREKIYLAIMQVADEVVIPEYDVLACAMDYFRVRNLDFVDCVLAARVLLEDEDVFSFDKKLMALIRQIRQPPE